MVMIVDHGTWQLAASDEGLHTPGPELLWNESYYFDFAAGDGSAGGYVRLGLYPNWQRAWYWACLVRPGQPTILLADNAAPMPAGGLMQLRTGTYAAGQEITQPLGAARLTLDGTAVLLPQPAAAYGDLSEAEPVRLALDLEWETAGGVYPYRDMARYEIPCVVTGSVVAGAEEVRISGFGERDHSWGERDWWQISWLWSSGRLEDGTAFHGIQANIGFAIPWPSFEVPPGGEVRHLAGFCAETVFDADGLPERSTLRLPGAPLSAIPLAFAPVALTSPDGRVTHFPRALCRLEAADGRAGYGWVEWNQPPGWREHDWSCLADPGAAGQSAG
jgi:hypothetical protein